MDYKDWKLADISCWLVSINMKQYVTLFIDNKIDGQVLHMLTELYFKELMQSKPLGDYIKLWNHILTLKRDNTSNSVINRKRIRRSFGNENNKENIIRLTPAKKRLKLSKHQRRLVDIDNNIVWDGKVIWFDMSKGYGYLSIHDPYGDLFKYLKDKPNNEIFVHHTQIKCRPCSKRGLFKDQHVQFIINYDKHGRSVAQNVTNVYGNLLPCYYNKSNPRYPCKREKSQSKSVSKTPIKKEVILSENKIKKEPETLLNWGKPAKILVDNVLKVKSNKNIIKNGMTSVNRIINDTRIKRKK